MARFAQVRPARRQVNLGGRQFACAELGLQPLEFDVAPAAVGLARLEVEQRKIVGARGRILRTRQRKRSLRVDRRGEELAAVQAPRPFSSRATVSVAETSSRRRFPSSIDRKSSSAPDRGSRNAAARVHQTLVAGRLQRHRPPSVIANGQV
jgi:hypothetical protein